MNKVKFTLVLLFFTLVASSAYTTILTCPINETCLEYPEYPSLYLPPVENKHSTIVYFLISIIVTLFEYSVWTCFGGNFITFCIYKYARYECLI